MAIEKNQAANSLGNKNMDNETLELLMVKKINESWVDEDKRRASLRKELEHRCGNRSHRYKKLVNRIKDNVKKHRITKQRSHNKKIMWYKTKNKDNRKKQGNSQFTTPRELERYNEVKVFSSNEELVPEPKKPPVIRW